MRVFDRPFYVALNANHCFQADLDTGLAQGRE
jgi:hypothetical protein